MRKESMIKKYEKKYPGGHSDWAVLHLEMEKVERKLRQKRMYSKQMSDLFEEINKVLCSDVPNLELIVYDTTDILSRTKKMTMNQFVSWYENLRNTDYRLIRYLKKILAD